MVIQFNLCLFSLWLLWAKQKYQFVIYVVFPVFGRIDQDLKY